MNSSAAPTDRISVRVKDGDIAKGYTWGKRLAVCDQYRLAGDEHFICFVDAKCECGETTEQVQVAAIRRGAAKSCIKCSQKDSGLKLGTRSRLARKGTLATNGLKICSACHHLGCQQNGGLGAGFPRLQPWGGIAPKRITAD